MLALSSACLALWQSVWPSDLLSIHLSVYSFVMWMAGGQLIFHSSRPFFSFFFSRASVNGTTGFVRFSHTQKDPLVENMFVVNVVMYWKVACHMEACTVTSINIWTVTLFFFWLYSSTFDLRWNNNGGWSADFCLEECLKVLTSILYEHCGICSP